MFKRKKFAALLVLALCGILAMQIPLVPAKNALDTAFASWSFSGREKVAKISVPRLNRTFAVLRGQSGDVLAIAPGWYEGSAFPGEPGISVISAYSDTDFSFLPQLQKGEQLLLETRDGVRKTYEVRAIEFTEEQAVKAPAEEGRSLLLLVTSYPFAKWQEGTSAFLVIIAQEISGETV